MPAAGRVTRDGEYFLASNRSIRLTFSLVSVLTRVNQKLKSSRLIGPLIRLAKFVPLSIRSISSRRFIKKFAREFHSNFVLCAMKSKQLVELRRQIIFLSISRFARGSGSALTKLFFFSLSPLWNIVVKCRRTVALASAAVNRNTSGIDSSPTIPTTTARASSWTGSCSHHAASVAAIHFKFSPRKRTFLFGSLQRVQFTDKSEARRRSENLIKLL